MSKFKVGPALILIVGLVLTMLLTFQNCSGFTNFSSEGSSAQNSQSGELPPADVKKSVTATEWQPLEINIDSASSQALTATSLPTGAVFDASNHRVLWMPKIGQSGVHHLRFSTPSSDNFLDVAVTVSALPVSQIAKGPMDGAQDGDVGFVFVHGMGTFDYCAMMSALDIYWGGGPQLVSRNPARAKISCYKSDQAPQNVAAQVAQQILDADCGRFEKCIVVTHSMGGLVLEFMLNHARPATASDPDPALFAHADLFKRASDRILSVASIASAAGGVLMAEALDTPPSGTVDLIMDAILTAINLKSDASRSMKLANVRKLAPFDADPGTPIFMIPGITPVTAIDAGFNLSNVLAYAVPGDVYDGNNIYAAIELKTPTNSRSDGLVELRSGCGLASDDVNDGPGYRAPVLDHLKYCYGAAKKPNHFLWFMTTMNHSFSQMQWSGCTATATLCKNLKPDEPTQAFKTNVAYNGKTVHEVMRLELDANRAYWSGNAPVTVSVK